MAKTNPFAKMAAKPGKGAPPVKGAPPMPFGKGKKAAGKNPFAK